MRSRWFPLIILTVGTFALGSAIVSLAVGEHKEEDFTISGAGDVQELVGGIRSSVTASATPMPRSRSTSSTTSSARAAPIINSTSSIH